MSQNDVPSDPREVSEYEHNRRQIPLEELVKYGGHFVAFSLDGTRILAAGKTMEEVDVQLLAMGVHPRNVVGSYIDSPDLVDLS